MTSLTHHSFLFIGLLFGLIMIVITPPFQVPDEVNHFYRAYQIADGGWKAEQHTQRLGGRIPRSLIKVAAPFLDLRWQMNRKTSYEIIIKQFSIPLNPEDKVFMDFPNTSLYNPVSYLPQVVPIFVLKHLNLPPLIIFYGARIFTLFFWIVCVSYIIKSLIGFKWLFTFLGLLPMSIFIDMGISADVVTNVIAFAFIGYMLNQSHKKSSFGRNEFLAICGFCILLASAKIVYIPLILLFLLIPKRRFSKSSDLWLQFAFFLILGFGVSFFWFKAISSIYIPYDQYNLAFRNFLDLPRCANMQGQLDFILNNGIYVFKVFFNSMYRTFDMYYPGYIGTFGWLDAKLPDWLIHLSYLVLLTIILFSDGSKIKLNTSQRLILTGSSIAITVAILVSQLLSWECLGNDFIKTIQGRYFIPVFPLLFLSVFGVFGRRITKDIIKKIVSFYSVFLLVISCIVIYKRYYVVPEYESTEIICDAENVQENKLVTSIPAVLLGNADRRTDEFRHSGSYSLKLSKEHPFGFTYRVTGGRYGDIIDIEVWRLGSSGAIVISGDEGKAFYVGTSEARYAREGDWNKLSYSYTLEADMHGKEITIYIFNKFEESYFDDIRIRISKKRKYLGF